MADFDAQILESQKQVAATQAKISELSAKIDSARSNLKAGQGIDIENATLDAVNKHAEVMNANIAELIMGLDDVTSGFSKDFEELRTKTGWESFIGIFSDAKVRIHAPCAPSCGAQHVAGRQSAGAAVEVRYDRRSISGRRSLQVLERALGATSEASLARDVIERPQVDHRRTWNPCVQKRIDGD